MPDPASLPTLKQISHEKFTDPKIGELLEDLRFYEQTLPYDSTPASLIRIARRDYEHAPESPQPSCPHSAPPSRLLRSLGNRQSS